jgi:putative methylase
MVSKKELAIVLSKLSKFNAPNVKLEQYITDSEIASDVLWQAFMREDIRDKIIADLGSGTGILGLGCLLLGAKKVYFVDIDDKVLEIAKNNLNKLKEMFEIKGKSEFINDNISNFNEKVDIVIQNPPFGTKQKHIDKVFLEKSFEISRKIYSFHKLTSKKFIDAISRDFSFKIVEILSFSFPLKKTMKFHKKKVEKIDVGCWILEKI